MTTFIADDFASLGAALREIEAAKSPTKAADVPAESVKVVSTDYQGATTWAGTYGLSAGSTDYMGYAFKDLTDYSPVVMTGKVYGEIIPLPRLALVEIDPSADYAIYPSV